MTVIQTPEQIRRTHRRSCDGKTLKFQLEAEREYICALEAELTRAKAKADRYESLLDLCVDLRLLLDRLGVQDYPAPEFRRRMDTALCEE